MAAIDFRVTEVNDLSKDGEQNKRVVLEANWGEGHRYDGLGDVTGDPKPFEGTKKISGRLELLLGDKIAAALPIGSRVAISFAVPLTQAEKDEAAAANKVANERAAREKDARS